MWNRTRSDQTSSVQRRFYLVSSPKSAPVLRIGVPLAVVAALLLGWYTSLASKASVSVPAPGETAPQQDSGTSHTANSADTNVTITQEGTDTSQQTELYINSEPIPIPESGSVHRVIQDDDTTTTVDVSVDSVAEGSSQRSSMNVELRSSSNVEVESSENRGP